MKRYVEVRSHMLGMHYYPEAPEEVAFLRNPHRHTFGVRARVAVTHDNRDVEFILLKRDVLAWQIITCKGTLANKAAGPEALDISKFDTRAWLFDFGARSCEMIAEEIFHHLSGLGYDVLEVGVSEDSEFEGVVTC